MNRLGIRTLSLVMLTFGGIWASCSVYNDTLLVKTEAGLGGGSGSGAGGGTCNSATFPKPPQDVGVGGGSIEIRAAMQTIDFGEVDPLIDGYSTPRPVGYDLDQTCGASCTFPSSPYWLPDQNAGKDGIDGRDNALGQLITKIETTFVKAFGSQSYNGEIAKGKVSVLFHVKDYNGQADDDQVTAILYQPAPMLNTQQVDTRTTPQWDGQDTWPVASDSLINSDFNQPAFQDLNAYVTNGVVVATMSSALLRVSVGISPGVTVQMNLHFVHAYYTAELVNGQNGWEMHNGQIVGRWPVQDLLSQLSQFPDPNDVTLTKPLCVNPTTYPNFRLAVCSFVDIGSESQPQCDALSVGIGFEALPALFGNVWELQPLTSRCPAATDPANDGCDKPLPTFDAATGGSGGTSTGGSGGTSTGGSTSGGTSGTGGTAGTSGSGGQSSGGASGATDASSSG